jgi:hypothetical protein
MANQPHTIDGDVLKTRRDTEPSFVNRLSRHLAWHLARRFVLEHPLLSAQLGFDAVKEAARFTLAERLQRSARDQDDSP